jgi:hypothetical protein
MLILIHIYIFSKYHFLNILPNCDDDSSKLIDLSPIPLGPGGTTMNVPVVNLNSIG